MMKPPALHPYLPRLTGDAEDDFRRSRSEWERRETIAVFLLLTAVLPLGLINDMTLLQEGPTRIMVQGLRGIVVALSVVIVGVTLRGADVRTRDILGSSAVVLLIAFEFANALNRPPDYIGYMSTSVMAVLVVFVAVPMPFVLKPWLLLVHVVGILSITWLVKEPPVPAALAGTLGLIAGWCVGLWMAIQLGRSNRTQFLTLERERNARLELEVANSEIQRLRGILPICSSCKRVRDDDGFWQQVEVFVEDRSDAQFSHGTCPACMRQLYPEYSDPPPNE